MILSRLLYVFWDNIPFSVYIHIFPAFCMHSVRRLELLLHGDADGAAIWEIPCSSLNHRAHIGRDIDKFDMCGSSTTH